MLADEILALINPSLSIDRDPFALLADDVQQAQRFVLDADVVKAADQVTATRPSSILAGLSFCRLPFSSIWIAYAGRERPGEFVAEGTRIPRRIGMLAKLDEERRGYVLIMPAWVFPPPMHQSVEICPVALAFDLSPKGDLGRDGYFAMQHQMSSLEERRRALTKELATPMSVTARALAREELASERELEAGLDLYRRTFLFPNPHFAVLGNALAERLGPAVMHRQMFGERIQIDAQRELSVFLGTLMLLNTPNGLEATDPALHKLNKSRTQSGKPPLLTHKLLSLKLTRVRTAALRAQGLSDSAIRAHLVRGHFKIRRTGVFWWNPFIRGDARRGLVTKDYRVREAPK